MSERQEILHLEDMYCLRRNRYTTITVGIHKWHHHIYRVALTFVEGYHSTSVELDKAIERRPEPGALYPEDYPKHFQMICRPRDLLHLTKVLGDVCEPEE